MMSSGYFQDICIICGGPTSEAISRFGMATITNFWFDLYYFIIVTLYWFIQSLKGSDLLP